TRRPPPTTPRTQPRRRCEARRRRTSASLREAANGREELLRLLARSPLVTGGERLRHAVLDVVVEDRDGEALERGRDGAELGQDVDAVPVVVDHALDPPHLALDPVQAGDDGLLVLGVPVGHSGDYTTGGIGGGGGGR